MRLHDRCGLLELREMQAVQRDPTRGRARLMSKAPTISANAMSTATNTERKDMRILEAAEHVGRMPREVFAILA
jgi:hypothetical protein